LQRISPSEIQHADNALSFAKRLVTDWLKEHKFKNWAMHRTHEDGTPVTPEQKEARASEIADELCDHSKWLSHGRSIKMSDLKGIGLEIIDYSTNGELADAILRYHILMQMTFDNTGIYKLFETPTSQIQKFMAPIQVPFPGFAGQQRQPRLPGVGLPGMPMNTSSMIVLACPKCKKRYTIQADFDQRRPLQPGAKPFPADDFFICGKCKTVHNLAVARTQLELQMKRKVAR
jgi:uncharacterized protein YbaR (Trm112 family)